MVDVLAEHVDDATWHEVSLLTIGYMGIIQQRDEAAGEVLLRLIGASRANRARPWCWPARPCWTPGRAA